MILAVQIFLCENLFSKNSGFIVLFFDNLWNISIMKVCFAGLFYVCSLLFIYNLIKRELLVFILIQRTVGKPLKYVFNVERTLVAMTNVDGDPSKPWRAVNGFWGKVVRELGLKNKLLVRKNLYQRWIEDRKGLRSQYTNTMTMYMMEWNVTPEVLAMDVSNIFNPKAEAC